jgi:hypothetical protein
MIQRVGGGVVALAASAGSVLLLAALASAQPFPPEPPEQRRAVAGWLVEYAGESDGGRIVRLTRAHGDYLAEYHVAFWRGNSGPYSGISIAEAGDSCGGETWQRDRESDVWRAEDDVPGEARRVRARLEAALAGCGARSGEAAAALAGFDRAFALAAEWTEVGRIATHAEIEAIVNYGNDNGVEANASE